MESYGFCWVCSSSSGLFVHEMASGAFREKAFADRITWVVACSLCNTSGGPLHSRADWPLPKQLALKWIHDRGYFELEKFNLLRSRAPGAIEMREVVPHICRLLDTD